jgi:hypothetical protein
VAVVDLIAEQDEMKAHSHEFVLWPRKWREFRDISVLTWQTYQLIERERPSVPDEAGIYTLLIQPGIADHPACSYVMYVGQTRSLRSRFGDYLSKEKRETGRPKIFRMLHMYPEHVFFCCAPVSETHLSAVEDALMVAYLPPANDQLPAEVRRVRGAF